MDGLRGQGAQYQQTWGRQSDPASGTQPKTEGRSKNRDRRRGQGAQKPKSEDPMDVQFNGDKFLVSTSDKPVKIGDGYLYTDDISREKAIDADFSVYVTSDLKTGDQSYREIVDIESKKPLTKSPTKHILK